MQLMNTTILFQNWFRTKSFSKIAKRQTKDVLDTYYTFVKDGIEQVCECVLGVAGVGRSVLIKAILLTLLRYYGICLAKATSLFYLSNFLYILNWFLNNNSTTLFGANSPYLPKVGLV